MNLSKNFSLSGAIFATFILTLLLSGCDLSTDVPKPNSVPTANHLLINEVFTLPASNQNKYSWIEIYNPKRDSVSFDSLLSFSIDTNGRVTSTVQFYALKVKAEVFGFNQNPRSPFQLANPKGVQEAYIPLSLTGTKIDGNDFAVFASDSIKLLDHTSLGPTGEYRTAILLNYDSLQPVGDAFDSPLQSEIKAYPTFFNFNLLASSEITLVRRTQTTISHIDSVTINIQGGAVISIVLPSVDSIISHSEEVIDVVRYGNFVSVGIDAYPGNKSAGTIPEYFSIARYSGGYYTGNSKRDFYFENQPVPLGQSSRRHR